MSPTRGVVAASHQQAAQAGADILREGGNAIDAAAAVQFALNVVEPVASGIGGGGFSLIHLAQGETFVLDSRERAPAAAVLHQFLDPNGDPMPHHLRETGGSAVGVPGVVMGQAVALRRWGTLPLARVLEPAIALAEGGVSVSSFLARRLERSGDRVVEHPASSAIFAPRGKRLIAGETLVQSDLGRTFRLIAERGPDVFYRGEIARALVAEVQARGGTMSLDDLASYQVEQREPLYGAYRGLRIATMPPPGAGLTLLQMLVLLEPFQLESVGYMTPERVHLELQAMRLALLDRAAYLGDPAYAAVPAERLLAREYTAERRRHILEGHLGSAPSAGLLRSQEPGSFSDTADGPGETTHFVVVDRWDNIVCCTTTIESWFGSGITVPRYGFLLNNELTDFDAHPGGPNEVRAFARPASSMAPTLVFKEGRPWLALGSPGGETIVAAIAQVLLGVIEDSLSLLAAIEAPRYFAQGFPRFSWERHLPEETLAGLRRFGHEPSGEPSPNGIGSVQAAMFDPPSGRFIGGADSRRDGCVLEVD